VRVLLNMAFVCCFCLLFFSPQVLFWKTLGFISSVLKILFLNLNMRSDFQWICFTFVVIETWMFKWLRFTTCHGFMIFGYQYSTSQHHAVYWELKNCWHYCWWHLVMYTNTSLVRSFRNRNRKKEVKISVCVIIIL